MYKNVHTILTDISMYSIEVYEYIEQISIRVTKYQFIPKKTQAIYSIQIY